MGRSRRKNALPEALRELGEAGLPEGYPDYWYGGGREGYSRSRLVPSALLTQEVLDDLSSRIWSRQEMADLFRSFGDQIDTVLFSANDPFVWALWESEYRTLEEAFREMGADAALLLLRENKDQYRQSWSQNLLTGLERQINALQEGRDMSGYIETSLWATIFRSSDRELHELAEGMIAWSERDRPGFRRFLTHTLLPGMRDASSFNVFPEHEHCARVALESLCGSRYLGMVAEDFRVLREAGYFQSGVREVDSLRILLEQIAVYRLGDDPEDWREIDREITHSYMINKLLDHSFRSLSYYSKRRKTFAESPVGKKVISRLGIDAEDLETLAPGMNDGIYTDILSGDLDIVGAWERAAQEVAYEFSESI